MESNENKPKNGVTRLRERFFEIKKSIKVTPGLKEDVRQKKSIDDQKEEKKDDQKKIASSKLHEDLDL